MTIAFVHWHSGWPWLPVSAVAVAILFLLCVWWLGRSSHDWLHSLAGLREHKRELRKAALAAVVLIAVALLSTQLPKIEVVLRRIERGDPWWLGLAVVAEAFSFLGYVVLTRVVLGRVAPRLNWPASVEVTFGGVVATRLFSAGGAGGIAFTAWALHAAGMSARTAARMIAAFLALLYAPYIAALIVGGLLPGVPDAVAIVGVVAGVAVAVAVALLMLIPGDIERRARALATGHGRLSKLGARLATVPAVAGEAVRTAFAIVRARPWLLLWAVLWWAADVTTLGFCFAAFGDVPGVGVLILGYFLGHVGNFLPLPGGVGGVEGGMIGVFAACGVPLSLAVVATLAYQAISTWLPVLPGLGAYFSLRRRIARWREEEALEAGGLQHASAAG
jgi:uncharacterized protein (TIRG00374 family)